MRRAMLLGLVAATVNPGCQALYYLNVEQPRTEVKSVRVVESTDQGARLLVAIALTNAEQDIPLPLTEVALNVNISGVGNYSYRDVGNATLPPGGTQTLTVPAALPIDGQVLAGASYTVNGAIRYKPPGELRTILTESQVPLPTVDFRGQGQLE